MRPNKADTPTSDLFRASLEAILDPQHELVRLAALIDWERFDDAFGPLYHEAKGRRGLPTRLMAGLHLLKHMKGLSDEETCAAWLENPYFQAFCGEAHFQHRLPLDRSSMTRWRKRIGPGDLEALLAETIKVAVETKAVSQRQLERITVDTTEPPRVSRRVKLSKDKPYDPEKTHPVVQCRIPQSRRSVADRAPG